jgi:hypothetical protein
LFVLFSSILLFLYLAVRWLYSIQHTYYRFRYLFGHIPFFESSLNPSPNAHTAQFVIGFCAILISPQNTPLPFQSFWVLWRRSSGIENGCDLCLLGQMK